MNARDEEERVGCSGLVESVVDRAASRKLVPGQQTGRQGKVQPSDKGRENPWFGASAELGLPRPSHSSMTWIFAEHVAAGNLDGEAS